MPGVNLPEKPCAACGRTITWRKKWERCWEEIRHCSEGCKRQAKSAGASFAALEETIVSLLSSRARDATICPSEAARAFYGEADWRGRMEDTRRAARRLVAADCIEITQGGRVVDPSTAKGAIRLRRGRRFPNAGQT